MTLSSHWTGVKFLRKIDLELIWNHCWVFSVQECEHRDQFLRISSKMIFVLDSGISGPWRGPLRVRSIEASVSRIVLLCADCGRRSETRWPWEGRCPLSGSLPHHSTFFHRLIYGDKSPSFFWPSKHSFLSKWLLHFLSIIFLKKKIFFFFLANLELRFFIIVLAFVWCNFLPVNQQSSNVSSYLTPWTVRLKMVKVVNFVLHVFTIVKQFFCLKNE